MKKLTLQQLTSGITPEGVRVVKFFNLVESHGVQIEDAIEFIHERDMLPDYAGFILEAITHKWNIERLVLKLDIAVCDIIGASYRDIWRKKLDAWLLKNKIKL